MLAALIVELFKIAFGLLALALFIGFLTWTGTRAADIPALRDRWGRSGVETAVPLIAYMLIFLAIVALSLVWR